MMKKSVLKILLLGLAFLGSAAAAYTNLHLENTRTDQTYYILTAETYRDKMLGGWLGQMVGVAWGFPVEFKYLGTIIPAGDVPEWRPDMINNAFEQDDLYVEMTFLKTLSDHGFDVSPAQAGIDFANSRYPLWHANEAARLNLRRGIAPPDSGHPRFNRHADDIDYQIESDFAGLISPGLPARALELGEIFGRMINYGDGLYGGRFVSAMYSLAFVHNDIETVIRAALETVPSQSQFAQTINDTLRWYHESPGDWQQTWKNINEKYHKNPDYRRFSCDKGDFNIDAKINAAYIVMGLLYGRGDIEKTVTVSMRCGQDADCNPSNAAGILFTLLGAAALPPQYTAADRHTRFSYTAYDLTALLEACEKLARQNILRSGGKSLFAKDGTEYFLIPQLPVSPGPLETCFAPGPAADSRFTPEQMKQIDPDLKISAEKLAPGWAMVAACRDKIEILHTDRRNP